MKPCPEHRRRIAWLAADALNENDAKQMRDHLNSCAGCRDYFGQVARICQQHDAAAEHAPEILLSPSFHQRLEKRIRRKTAASGWASTSSSVRNWLVGWRIAIPAGVCALLFLASWQGGKRRGALAPVPTSPPAIAAVAGSANIEPEATYSSYRMAANTSLDALDALLNRQAARESAPSEVLTVSTATRAAAGE